MEPLILVFAGSLRARSMNRQLAAVAAAAVEEAGGNAELLELADYPMPMYDEDEETRSGLPEPVRAFKAKVVAAPGYIVCSPEYNGSLSPLLKNSLDWLSRQGDDPRPRAAYDGKVIGLMAASDGGLGGLARVGAFAPNPQQSRCPCASRAIRPEPRGQRFRRRWPITRSAESGAGGPRRRWRGRFGPSAGRLSGCGVAGVAVAACDRAMAVDMIGAARALSK